MKKLRKFLAKTGPVFVLLLFGAIGFSFFAARRACDEIMKSELAPPPRYSTQFVLHPERYLEQGVAGFGLKPGWVVTYAPRGLGYGTAFFVTPFGKVLTRGTPQIVARQHIQDNVALDKFKAGFAQVDAAVQVGNSFSNVIKVLGTNYFASTNNDGSFFAIFNYEPRVVGPVEWLTNGFSLKVSKSGIVTQKDYGYTSR